MTMPKLYSDKTENLQWLTISNGVTYNMQGVYSVPISAKTGDIIDVSFEGEVTNPQNYNLEVGSYIVLGSTATDTAQSKSILRAQGENLTPVGHHMVVEGACKYEFSIDFTGFVNVVMYSNSTAVGSGQQIEVMQSYGQLDVLHFVKDVVLPTDGSITLTSAQRQKILAALHVGDQERAEAAALLQ